MRWNKKRINADVSPVFTGTSHTLDLDESSRHIVIHYSILLTIASNIYNHIYLSRKHTCDTNDNRRQRRTITSDWTLYFLIPNPSQFGDNDSLV